MNRQVFEAMVEELLEENGEVSVIVDAVSGHGGYSSGQTHFKVKRTCIFPHNEYVTFENIRTKLDTSDKSYICLAIPYERIIGVGVER